jgi:hypothetical protein
MIRGVRSSIRRGAAIGAGIVVISLGAVSGAPAAFAQAGPVLSGGEFSFNVGVFEPRGESAYWDRNGVYLTRDAGDFTDIIGGGAFASHLNPHLDLQIGGQYYRGTADVAYRGVVDIYGDPVVQRQILSEFPIDFSVKFLPISRMTTGGASRVMTLRPVVPYFGGGVGALMWEYSEEGQFLDNLADPTFAYYDERSARGVTLSVHVLGGVEVQLSPWVALWFEGRYRWAEDHLGGDFGYDSDEFDLSGGSLTFGTSFRF